MGISFCRCHSDLHYDFGCSFDYHCVFVDEDQEFGHKNKAMFLETNKQTNTKHEKIAQTIWEHQNEDIKEKKTKVRYPVIKDTFSYYILLQSYLLEKICKKCKVKRKKNNNKDVKRINVLYVHK